MPMTFDTYNICSYNCLYCFSFFQKSHSLGDGGTKSGGHDYQKGKIGAVNPEKIKKIFTFQSGSTAEQQFYPYIKARKWMQWGGLADQFDEHERKYGITLELLKFFKEINYPICFSTKAVWWTLDERYTDLFRGQKNWNVKFSIINLDAVLAKKIELGVPSPQERLEAIGRVVKLDAGGATLRLRPFIIGMSDRRGDHLNLIRKAAEMGATAVSTEFFCLDYRADARLRDRYNRMSAALGFDIYQYYKANSRQSGYQRLSYEIKTPYVTEMRELAHSLGMRFYVSDAHHKDKSDGGSCCGLNTDCNYSRGQFTQALIIARDTGRVHFSDIAADALLLHQYSWKLATGYNTNGYDKECVNRYQSMFEYIRNTWNDPNNQKSPYKYFNGILKPDGLDEEGNVVYIFDYERANLTAPEALNTLISSPDKKT
jgi:DNA repair photolyase